MTVLRNRLPPLSDEQSCRVECLRAFACLLLVAFHVIGNGPLAGIRVVEESAWHDFERTLRPLRMPLFTFLSGYLYASLAIDSWGAWRTLVARKAARLLLPYLLLTPLFVLGQRWSNGQRSMDLTTLAELYVLPQTIYWFLPALFLIFVVISTWQLSAASRWTTAWCALFAGWWALNVLQPIQPNVLGFGQALALGPCFIVGIAARRDPQFWRKTSIIFAVAIAAALSYGLYVYAQLTQQWTHIIKRALVFAPIGCLLCLTLIYRFPALRWLARLGPYAFSIFLFHSFFITAARLMMQALGATEPLALFAVGLIAGVGGSVVVERVLGRFGPARFLLLGQPYAGRRERAASNPLRGTVGATAQAP